MSRSNYVLMSIEADNILPTGQFISIFEWTSSGNLSLSIEAKFNNVSIMCRKKPSSSSSFNPHPCQSFPSRWSSRSWHEWPAAADVEVRRCQMQILKHYPRCAWLKSAWWQHWLWLLSSYPKADCHLEVPLESQTTDPNHQLTISWDIFVDISWSLLFWMNLRSWVAWIAAHWRSKGHQRVGYPHSCP